MRDALIRERLSQKITLKQITNRLCKIQLPEWLQGQIMEMAEHNKYNRATCPVEQAMLSAVCYHILDKIIKEDRYAII